MIKRRKKIAAMLVASMILVTSLPNTAEAFRLQHRKKSHNDCLDFGKNAFKKYIKTFNCTIIERKDKLFLCN